MDIDKAFKEFVEEELNIEAAFVEEFGLDERKMTDGEKEEREEIVKKLKPKLQSFKDRYGDDAKKVMYATATKQAMEEVELDEKEKFAGWIAFYNKDKLEIKPKKGVIDSLYDAKQAAIKHFKVPKSKQGLLAIEPAHEEVKVEKTISKLFSHVRKLMSK